MASCPNCGFPAGPPGECSRCGIVYARWRGHAHPSTAPLATRIASEPDPLTAFFPLPDAPPRAPDIDRQGWLAYGGGLAAALVVLTFPLLRFILSTFTTLVHEMGHAAAGWVFGYPSVPAFDFAYGGGVTLQQDRVLLLVVGVIATGAWGAWALREDPRLRNTIMVALAGYGLLAVTRGHEALIVGMGHGGELFFATLFLHRALSGRGCTIPVEQPLYGLLGWFLVLSDLGFAWQLRTSSFHRELYEEAKGGGHWMDFSRLAEEFLHVRLETVATAFLLLCLLPPVLALLAQRLRRN